MVGGDGITPSNVSGVHYLAVSIVCSVFVTK